MKNILIYLLLNTLIQSSVSAQTFEWAKSMGGIGNDYGTSILLDDSGNVQIMGSFEDTADFDPASSVANLTSSGGSDIFMQKLDATGSFVWAKSFGGTGNDYGKCMAIDNSGNIYITGTFVGTADFIPGTGIFSLTSLGNTDVFISKYDSLGNFLWAKSIGGTGSDAGTSIAFDGSGNVYTTGWFRGIVDFNPGVGVFNLTSNGIEDIFISKLDASGNFVWAKAFGGSDHDNGNSLVIDTSDNVYITGYFQHTVDFDPSASIFNLTSIGNSFSLFISKFDSFGNFVWAKSLEATSVGNSLVLDAMGNILITGYFEGQVDFDPGPSVFDLTTSFSSQTFITKLSSSGNFIWAKTFKSTGDGIGNFITIDSFENVYTTGYFGGQADFNPNSGVFNLSSNSNSKDVFISKLDSSGNFVWAKSFGASGQFDEAGSSIGIDSKGSVFTTGWFRAQISFQTLGAPTVSITSVINATYDIFLHKMSQPIIGINENTFSKNIEIYPNPTRGLINLVFPESETNFTIEIYNELGILIYKQFGFKQSPIDITKYSNGLYLLRLISNEKILTAERIIKE